MSDCIFCGIVDGSIPSETVFEDNEVVAFKDVNPAAPHHVLIIPKKHIATVDDLTDGDTALVGRMVVTAKNLAAENKLTDGYRLVMNCGSGAGQTVFHIHLHLLAGRPMLWPPG